MLANGIDDNKKKVTVFVIGQNAYALLRKLVAPTKPYEKKYDEVVKGSPKAETTNDRRAIPSKTRSIAQFLAELAETCNLGAKTDR